MCSKRVPFVPLCTLQVGGLRYVYDARRPVGQRVLSVTTASGLPIDPCRQYIVLTYR